MNRFFTPLVYGIGAVLVFGLSPVSAQMPDATPATNATPATDAPPTSAAPPSSGMLMDLDATFDPANIKANGKIDKSIIEQNGKHLLKVEFPGQADFPGIIVERPPDGWDLTGYTGVQVDVTNSGNSTEKFGLRVDNPGSTGANNWGSKSAWIGPGETKTIQVIFDSQSGGRGPSGYSIIPAKVVRLNVFAAHTTAEGSFLVSNLMVFGK
jgi:hypothetical protein